jgi:hypothetical protein
VHPVALLTYTIQTYNNIGYIYIYIYIYGPQSQLTTSLFFKSSLHVSAPTGHLQVRTFQHQLSYSCEFTRIRNLKNKEVVSCDCGPYIYIYIYIYFFYIICLYSIRSFWSLSLVVAMRLRTSPWKTLCYETQQWLLDGYLSKCWRKDQKDNKILFCL